MNNQPSAASHSVTIANLNQKLLLLRIDSMMIDARLSVARAVQDAKTQLSIETDERATAETVYSLAGAHEANEHLIDEVERQIEEASREAWEKSTPLRTQLATYYRGETPSSVAEQCLQDLNRANHVAEFAWSDQVNPEATPQRLLYQAASRAWELAIIALDALPDAEMRRVLEACQQVEHDGSTFVVTTIEEVRALAAKMH